MNKGNTPKALDKDGHDTGLRLDWQEIHGPRSRPDLYCATAHIWVYNSKGEVLLQKRGRNVLSYPGRWDIAASGHIDYGETPLTGARRELEEEIGISGEVLEFVGEREGHRTVKPGNWQHNEFVWVYLLRLDRPTSEFAIQPEEVDDLQWLTLDKLEMEIHNPKTAERYVPHSDYYDFIIAKIRKRLKA